MKKDIKKIIVIILFGLSVLSFKTIKEGITKEYFKSINFMSNNVQGTITY